MSAERYTTDRSALNKKPEWGGALVCQHQHQQRAVQQQNAQQTWQAYAHHQLAGGCLDGRTFQPDAGILHTETVYEDRNATIDACGVQQACHFNTAAEDTVHCDDYEVGAVHVQPASAPQERFGMRALDTSTNNNCKRSVNTAAEPHQAKSRDHVICVGRGNLSMSTSIKMPAPRSRTRKYTSMSPLTVRSTGTKDRHSKVRTAKGLRDRRVRLSGPTAIQFFDVQDRLGYDQPSKAVDWLIKKARASIDELAPVEVVIVGNEATGVSAQEQKLSKDHHGNSFVKVKDAEQSMAVPTLGGVRAESRAKARERARERAAKEKCVSSTPPAASSGEAAVTSAATTPLQSFTLSTSPHVHLLPEFFLLSGQLPQQFDDPHHASDLLPLPSHFFPSTPPSSATSFVYPAGDVPSDFQFSTPVIYATNNTPISPRGTLQSIFSNPADSSMQSRMSMLPLNMMMGALQQAHVYGATLNSAKEDQHDNDEEIRQRSAELGSPDLHQHSRVPMRIHGMELDSNVEETRITSSSMQADFQ